MQFFIKLFLIALIIKFAKCEIGFCDNEHHSNCSLNDMMFSDAEVIDLNSLVKHAMHYFKGLNEEYNSKIKAISDDLNLIKTGLLDSMESESHCLDTEEKSSDVEEKNTTTISPSLYDNMWVVIQRREDGSSSFYRSWDDYKKGFGNQFREFFIGLDRIHYLTNSKSHELLIQLEDFNETLKYALYDEFVVGNETENYQLKKLGVYSGDAGDYMRNHVGMFFSTKDRDNDASNDLDCAKHFQGGWWYSDCLTSHLNGPYRTRFNINKVGITWGNYDEMQVKTVQMMIRSRAIRNKRR